MTDSCTNWMNATIITQHSLVSLFIHKSLSQKTALLNVKKLQGGAADRTWFHCYALWLYTGQVESLSSSSENNLFLQKIGMYWSLRLLCTKRKYCRYLCHLSWTLIFSISLQFHLSSDNAQQKKMLTEKLYVCMLDYILSHLPDTPISAALLVLGQFFDDRQWQSWVELHGSCLSSGCSVWCTFDVVQAHCRPRLWLLAYDTKLRQSWNLEGRKEGSTLPRQSTQFEKQQPVITQSVLIHCGIVQGFRCFVFDGFQKKKRRINV